ncbi:MarR family winged helix-turn-helix transcriptional regulator [Caulobacter sp. FWC2]|uniref:MarR family winged helix-turn-helix transcriptional regulator n=1 Tax=Caulobacter sp. FWC2 TaxID=69664 RepID=UPI000C15E86A|nr:MarR family transcriptional regulator [Caulobacter sp. FWC2]PIB90911.1 MarR family transcriptional regulator [Caulobacter sp. FWC2]
MSSSALGPEFIPLDNQLCFSLYATTLAINRTYKPMLDALGITYPQYLVLSALWEDDGQTIGAIGTRLSLEPSTITPLVKRLEHAGFVDRQRDPIDERQVRVRLSKKGLDLRADATCLTSTLLAKSGLTVPQITELNTRVLALRRALVGED